MVLLKAVQSTQVQAVQLAQSIQNLAQAATNHATTWVCNTFNNEPRQKKMFSIKLSFSFFVCFPKLVPPQQFKQSRPSKLPRAKWHLKCVTFDFIPFQIHKMKTFILKKPTSFQAQQNAAHLAQKQQASLADLASAQQAANKAAAAASAAQSNVSGGGSYSTGYGSGGSSHGSSSSGYGSASSSNSYGSSSSSTTYGSSSGGSSYGSSSGGASY